MLTNNLYIPPHVTAKPLRKERKSWLSQITNAKWEDALGGSGKHSKNAQPRNSENVCDY